jgi:hypothetical protein
MKGNSLAPPEAYEAVLRKLAERNLYQVGRAMLCAQYAMPGRAATMRRLAAAVGYPPDHRTANFVYGSFAGRVRRELQLARPKYEIWVLVVWPEPPLDELAEFAFRLRPEVATAIERLGWSPPISPTKPR